jgi:Uma2 family endonuclease
MRVATAPQPVIAPVPLSCAEALYEVVNGQRVELPPMGAYATWIASRLHGRLGPFAEAQQLGTTVIQMLFIIDGERDLRRRPDVAFVSANRWPLDRDLPVTGDWAVVPDLAVEVVSPHDLFKDVMAKLREYFQAGTQQVWVILPDERHVYVYTSPTQMRILTLADELDAGLLLPGWRLPVAHLFTRPVAASQSPTAF